MKHWLVGNRDTLREWEKVWFALKSATLKATESTRKTNGLVKTNV